MCFCIWFRVSIILERLVLTVFSAIVEFFSWTQVRVEKALQNEMMILAIMTMIMVTLMMTITMITVMSMLKITITIWAVVHVRVEK